MTIPIPPFTVPDISDPRWPIWAEPLRQWQSEHPGCTPEEARAWAWEEYCWVNNFTNNVWAWLELQELAEDIKQVA
jgi:hypothetical protein